VADQVLVDLHRGVLGLGLGRERAQHALDVVGQVLGKVAEARLVGHGGHA
jgi:hypothetical protein